MKIGMLSQWYDPETGPAALPGVYAREFTQQGHQVSVLTGFPNYPEGRLYTGYKIRPRVQEYRDSVRVTRVALYPEHSGSALKRIVNYSSFGVSAALLGINAIRGVDAIWVYNSPITVSLPLLTHSRMGRVPFFLHLQDLWPDSLVESGMLPDGRAGQIASDAIDRIVRLTERKAAVIGVISPSVRDLLIERHPGLDPEKILYAPNPTNESLFRPISETRADLGLETGSAGFELMYAGAMGEVQGLETLISAMSLLSGRTDISLSLVGDGISRDRLQKSCDEKGLSNVRFLGRVPQADVPVLIARADAQVVSLASSPFLRYTTPSKIPSLLASAVPIIAQIEGDGAKVLADSGAALVVEPGNPGLLAQDIERLADMSPLERSQMGEAGRLHYNVNFSARASAATITDALAKVSR